MDFFIVSISSQYKVYSRLKDVTLSVSPSLPYKVRGVRVVEV